VRRYFAASGDWRSRKKRVREAEAAKFVEVAVKPVKPGWRSSAGDDKTLERSEPFCRSGIPGSHLRALLSELEG
jgi:hypothetical protein